MKCYGLWVKITKGKNLMDTDGASAIYPNNLFQTIIISQFLKNQNFINQVLSYN